MFGDGSLAFREFVVGEALPLARIQEAVLEFLRGREDAVLFGAQAVNAYVGEARMTEDVDILSPRAAPLADELRAHLAERFQIAVRVREVGDGRGYRLFQARKTGSRHLVDLRPVPALPPSRRIEGILVLTPPELVATKVIAYHLRRGRPKSGSDWRDLAHLLLTFPELKHTEGPVRDALRASGADAGVLAAWDAVVVQAILPESEDDEFG